MLYISCMMRPNPIPEQGFDDQNRSLEEAMKSFEEIVLFTNLEHSDESGKCLQLNWYPVKYPKSGGKCIGGEFIDVNTPCDCGNCDGLKIMGSVLMIESLDQSQMFAIMDEFVQMDETTFSEYFGPSK
ncbi:hypothetical protein SEA_KEELAN_130 [Gordonia phage Keelan]|nr:hypothetical protein SEA_KEELAN_130 [Gordonia phage Keelan]